MKPAYVALRVCERFGIDPARVGADVGTVGGRLLLEAYEHLRRCEEARSA